jgi:hypothetical protein
LDISVRNLTGRTSAAKQGGGRNQLRHMHFGRIAPKAEDVAHLLHIAREA